VLTFDIPVNFSVNAATEEEAEQVVRKLLEEEMAKPALNRAINDWDFVEFVSDDEPDSEFFMGS